MLEVKEHYQIKKYNTFGISVKARYFVTLSNEGEICHFLSSNYMKINPKLILGGGSNILFTEDFEGLIIRPDVRGIEMIKEDEDYVWLKVGAGENWDKFVEYCIKMNFGGLENLSYIPGTVGACPVQNIGAYGTEVKETIDQVETIVINSGEKFILSNSDCNFSYRNSIFKNDLYRKCIISRVIFKLWKKPVYKTEYNTIREELNGFREINLHNIRQAVINIRRSKLPEPDELGNAGSFFKNPFISERKAGELQKDYPGILLFEDNSGKLKISAAWLIEQSGFKGYREGYVGTYSKQPLIIVNYGNATGMDILNFSEKIRKKISEEFNIQLETEVNVL